MAPRGGLWHLEIPVAARRRLDHPGLSMLTRLARIALLVLWVGLMFALLRAPEDSPPTRTQLPIQVSGSAREGWMGLYLNQRKVGYSHFESTPIEGGYQIVDRSVLRLRMLERDQTIFTQSTAETAADHSLKSFRVRLQSDIGRFQLRGEVAGDELLVDLNIGGQNDRHRFPLERPIFLPSSLRASVVGDGLQAGAMREAAIFDAAAMSAEPVVVRTRGRETLAVEGGEVEAWRMTESFRGIETTVWIDAEGRVLREEGPLGLVAVREDAERATEEGWGDGNLVDLMDAVAVPVRNKIPAPRSLARLKLRVGGLGAVEVPSDQRQSLRAGVLTVERESASTRSTFALPYSGQEWQKDLRASAFVQSDHPRVRQRLEEVAGGEKSARDAAIRLRRWIYDNIEKRAVASIPNTLQVLEMGAGDCNEHAVLFAGLGRAAGLPTRIVAGLVYMEGVFLYHAWNEVWLGDGWVSVDAALDQMPADVTHIKFIEGEPDRHAELVPLIGRLSLDYITGDT